MTEGIRRGKNTASLETIATEIKGLERRAIANVVEIGGLLTQAREQCEHGQYEDWLRKNFDWSLTTASRYRSVFEFSEEPQIRQFGGFARLNISLSAVYLLTECDLTGSAARMIIEAAQKGRVTYAVAQEIISGLIAG